MLEIVAPEDVTKSLSVQAGHILGYWRMDRPSGKCLLAVLTLKRAYGIMTSYMTIEMLLPQKRLVTIGLRAREVRRYHVYHVRGMSVICGMSCGMSGGGVNGNGKPDSFIVGCSCQWYVMVALWNVFRPSGSESTEVSYFGRPLPAITNPQAACFPGGSGMIVTADKWSNMPPSSTTPLLAIC